MYPTAKVPNTIAGQITPPADEPGARGRTNGGGSAGAADGSADGAVEGSTGGDSGAAPGGPGSAPARRSRPWRTPAEALLTTADGVRIHAEHRPRRPAASAASGAAVSGAAVSGDGAEAGELAVVLVHGFTGSVDRPAVRRAAEVFARSAGVVTLSMRGHGRSGGTSTVGAREVLDVDAAVRWARALGYRRVATVGFSLGGAVVVRHAAVCGGVRAVAAVSAPARWYYQGTAPMRRLHWVVMRPAGRLVGRLGLKTRIDAVPWPHSTGGGRAMPPHDPIPPVEAAAALGARALPLLVVHGDADPYFPLDHPRSLAAAYAAGAGAETESETERQDGGGGREPRAGLWIEPGFGHAENNAAPELLERIAAWLTEASQDAAPGGAT